ncbi:hypothetical protein ACOSQ3_032518 [Xanthoceras sorbifolium]
METRGKTNSKFQNEVSEILAWHKSSFDLLNTNFNQVNAALQTVLTELQALYPAEWIYKAEQYFEFKDVNPTYQVQLASFHLEGIALQWHRWITKFCGSLTWEEFTKALLTSFGPTEYDNPLEALTRLNFVAGLKDEIRLDVKVKDPSTLYEAIGTSARVPSGRHNPTEYKPFFFPSTMGKKS